MDAFRFTYRGVTLCVSYGYPSRYRPCYTVQAEREGERAFGWVRYVHLSRSGAVIECLEFFDQPTWLRAALFSSCGGEVRQISCTHTCNSPLAVVLDEAAAEQLAVWMASDYRDRLYDVLAQQTSIALGMAPLRQYHVSDMDA